MINSLDSNKGSILSSKKTWRMRCGVKWSQNTYILLIFKRAMTSLFMLLVMHLSLGCGMAYGDTSDPLLTALNRAKFTAFKPPRDENLLGSIIRLSHDGEEVIVAKANHCFPNLKIPHPVDTVLFDTSSSTEYQGGLSGYAGIIVKKLGSLVDLSFTEKSNSTIKANLKLGNPKLSQLEEILVKDEVKKMDKKGSCFKEIAKKDNFIIFGTLTVASIELEFKDESNHSIKISGELSKTLKISPELARKNHQKDSIAIEKQMVIGYRLIKANELFGLNADDIELNVLEPSEVEKYREFFMKQQ